MNATPETYERAINALARQNDALIRENRALKAEVERLRQGLMAEMLDVGLIKGVERGPSRN